MIKKFLTKFWSQDVEFHYNHNGEVQISIIFFFMINEVLQKTCILTNKGEMWMIVLLDSSWWQLTLGFSWSSWISKWILKSGFRVLVKRLNSGLKNYQTNHLSFRGNKKKDNEVYRAINLTYYHINYFQSCFLKKNIDFKNTGI